MSTKLLFVVPDCGVWFRSSKASIKMFASFLCRHRRRRHDSGFALQSCFQKTTIPKAIPLCGEAGGSQALAVKAHTGFAAAATIYSKSQVQILNDSRDSSLNISIKNRNKLGFD